MKSFFIDIFRRNVYLLVVAFVLFLCGYFLNLYFNSNASVAVLRNSIQNFMREREKDFDRVTADTALVNRLAGRQYSAQELAKVVEKKYGIFLYTTDSTGSPDTLRFWNDQRSLPTPALVNSPDGSSFMRLSNGQYEVKRRTLAGNGDTSTVGKGRPVVAIALIPIRWQYYIATSNLVPEFVDNSAAEERVEIATVAGEFPVLNSQGTTLFYLNKKANYHASAHNWTIPFSVLLGLLLILVIIHNIAHTIREKWGAAWG
ncbi:hypothetical protein ACQ86N_34470 [Puia sp. P3]|uniref:hypothetical protein n=1 Tax=Puia sp. P3 TaxID=3423952 RepID=UPI003D663D31